jgi:hypothetical protein
MNPRFVSLLLIALAGCVLSPDLVAQLGDTETGELTETGQPPDEPSCVGDCPCTEDFCNQSCPPDFQSLCDMECPPGATCTQTCEAGFCSSDCFEGSSCYQQCLTGDCTTSCHAGNCHMNCPNGNCTMLCVGSNCTIEQCPSGCTIFCGGGSTCSTICADPMACIIEYF